MQAKTKYRGPGKTEIDYYIRLGKVQVQGPGIQATQKKTPKILRMFFAGRFRRFENTVHTIFAHFLVFAVFFCFNLCFELKRSSIQWKTNNYLQGYRRGMP